MSGCQTAIRKQSSLQEAIRVYHAPVVLPPSFPPSSLQQGHSKVLSMSFFWPPSTDWSRAQEMYAETNTELGNPSWNPQLYFQ